jgi:hypothetical protein
MKTYPDPNRKNWDNDGFTADEIRRGIHWVYTDCTCTECGKVQSLAASGSTDNGKCIKCGGNTA